LVLLVLFRCRDGACGFDCFESRSEEAGMTTYVALACPDELAKRLIEP
jgi:hypothetical protein